MWLDRYGVEYDETNFGQLTKGILQFQAKGFELAFIIYRGCVKLCFLQDRRFICGFNRIHCCYLFVFWAVFWRRLLPISGCTTKYTTELLHGIKLRRNAICFHLADTLLSLLHLKRDCSPILKWLWIFSVQISISLLDCYFS